MSNAEDSVISMIDQLVDESLAHGPTDDYSRDILSRSFGAGRWETEQCEVCTREWHGQPRHDCPGPWGTDEAKNAYIEAHRPRATGITLNWRDRGHRRTRRPDFDLSCMPMMTVPNNPLIPQHHHSHTTFLSEGVSLSDGEGIVMHTWLPGDLEMEVTNAHPVVASPEMTQALNEHVARYPQDQPELMRRFRSLIFAPDGRPVPWTPQGLYTVLGGNQEHVEWAQRQLNREDIAGVYGVPSYMLGSAVDLPASMALAPVDEEHYTFLDDEDAE